MSQNISSLDIINTNSMVIHNKKNLLNVSMTKTTDTIINDALELSGLDEMAVVVLFMVALVILYASVTVISMYCFKKSNEESLRNSPQGRPLSYAELYTRNSSWELAAIAQSKVPSS